MKLKAIGITVGLVAVFAVASVVYLRAAPSISQTSATPAYVVENTPTAVLFTAQIADPSVIRTGVNLLKTDSTGKTLAVAGVLNDNGMNGDATANDKIFSLSVTLNQPSTGQVYYRVSAPFKGVLQRALSPVIVVDVWQRADVPSGYATIAVPPSWLLDEASPEELSVSSPELQRLTEEHDAEVPPADLTIRALAKEPTLSLEQFAAQLDSGWLEAYAQKTSIVVSGQAGVLYSDIAAVVQHQPILVALIDDHAHDQVLIITALQVGGNNPQDMFQRIVSTLMFR